MRSGRLGKNILAVSSFSLLAVMVLLFTIFMISYLAYATQVDVGYRLKSTDIEALDMKTLGIAQDLEDHAVWLAEQSLYEGANFTQSYDTYVITMGAEDFDIWRTGDVVVRIDGLHSTTGGTLDGNYTVKLKPDGDNYLVAGQFNITARNLRTGLELRKTIFFEKQISSRYGFRVGP